MVAISALMDRALNMVLTQVSRKAAQRRCPPSRATAYSQPKPIAPIIRPSSQSHPEKENLNGTGLLRVVSDHYGSLITLATASTSCGAQTAV